ncbi:MAG: hypothetical protein NTY64_10955 [Deltaproteobacteria bacterium]|nr:hypothetical protein [Deltaproteobacteria bacterium]
MLPGGGGADEPGDAEKGEDGAAEGGGTLSGRWAGKRELGGSAFTGTSARWAGAGVTVSGIVGGRVVSGAGGSDAWGAPSSVLFNCCPGPAQPLSESKNNRMQQAIHSHLRVFILRGLLSTMSVSSIFPWHTHPWPHESSPPVAPGIGRG